MSKLYKATEINPLFQMSTRNLWIPKRKLQDKPINNAMVKYTPEASVVAGWISADGNMYRNSLQINLKGCTAELLVLEDIRDFLGCSTVKISHVKKFNKDYNKTYTGYSFCPRSQQLINDLTTYWNIFPAKSLINEPPVLPTRYLELLWILGYFMGDGSITHSKNDKSLKSNCLGTYNVMEWLKARLSEYCIGGSLLKEDRKTENNTWRLSYSHRDTISLCALFKALWGQGKYTLPRKTFEAQIERLRSIRDDAKIHKDYIKFNALVELNKERLQPIKETYLNWSKHQYS